MKRLHLFLATALLLPQASAQTTVRASVATGDLQLNTASGIPRLSGDGRYTLFSSPDLVLAPNANGMAQVYAYDRDPDGNGILDEGNSTTTMLSVTASGNPGNGHSGQATISADGRWVAFTTGASNFSTYTWTSGATYVLDRDSDHDGIYDELPNAYHAIRGLSDAAPNGGLAEFGLTADGQYLSFSSTASNLVTGDSNNQQDVFRWQRASGQIVRCSVSTSGVQGNGRSGVGSISDDGRLVAFDTQATSLWPGSATFGSEILVHDVLTGITTPVSINDSGQLGLGLSNRPHISGNGLFVAFASFASNFATIDNDFQVDIFVRDLFGGTTTLVSVDSLGNKGIAGSTEPFLSTDGNRVCFRSLAPNLYWNDNNSWDVFVHDRTEGWTRLVSRASDGTHGNGQNAEHAGFHFAAGGSSVAFTSESTNLVDNDTNGLLDIFVHEVCPTGGVELGFALAGYQGLTPELLACGELSGGSQATLTLLNAAPNRRGAFFVSPVQSMTPLYGGMLIPGAPYTIHPFATLADGRAQVHLAGGGGPGTLYVQALLRDLDAPLDVSFSNALALPLLP